jgi:hypothetical protein
MPTTRRRSRKRSAIEIQISATVEAPKNGRALSKDVIREAIQYRVENGENPPGIELNIVSWKHGDREKDANDSDEEWAQFGRFLQGSSIIVHTITKVRSR